MDSWIKRHYTQIVILFILAREDPDISLGIVVRKQHLGPALLPLKTVSLFRWPLNGSSLGSGSAVLPMSSVTVVICVFIRYIQIGAPQGTYFAFAPYLRVLGFSLENVELPCNLETDVISFQAFCVNWPGQLICTKLSVSLSTTLNLTLLTAM